MAELSKTYDSSIVEPKWYRRWLDRGDFHAEARSPKPAFSIVIPPPNITGVLTLGHVLNNTIQDILARRARMLGHEVLWLPGTDHAGLATQSAVEKALRKTEKVTRHDLGRQEFLRRTWEWREKHGRIIFEQLKRLGCSCDWARERFTLDAEYARAVQQVFVDLHAKKLIYRGRRMINWDPAALTALSDEEVIPTKQKSTLYYVRYEVVEKPGRFLEVATTRPETIMADTAVAVHPNDPRYRDLIGRNVWRPLAREQLQIIGDAAIDPEFGTGVLKVTPAHDKVDFEIGQGHKLPVIDVLHPDGRINCPAVPELDGLDRFEARKKAAQLLAERGLLAKEEPYENTVGFSERAGVAIEPRLSEQWFLRYPKTKEALAVVREHLIRFFPAHWEKVYGQWLENIQDWCISRQVWWGHRIPAWYNGSWSAAQQKKIQIVRQSWGEISGAHVREMRRNAWRYAAEHGFINTDFPNLDAGFDVTVQKSSLAHAFANPGLGNIKLLPSLPRLIRHAVRVAIVSHDPPAREVVAVHVFYAALQLGYRAYRVKFTVKEFRSRLKLYNHQSVEIKKMEADGKYPPEEAPVSESFASWPASASETTLAELVECVNEDPAVVRIQLDSPGEDWRQDEDTLDTWFSSWLWAYETMDAETRAKFYPTSVLVTAPDIIFFWVARMIIAGLEFKPGKTERAEHNIPFRDVYFTGLIRDRSGRKMSKSLGNSPDPLELMAKYGADGLRFGLMRIAPSGQDIRFDEKQIEEGRNFATKLWNAARLRQMHGGEPEGEIDPALLTSDDKWILLRLDAAIRDVSRALDEYNFSEAAQALYRFFWGEYCDWYLEATKATLGAPDAARKANTLAVMDFVLGHTLRLLHPYLPFITEELWHGLGFNADLPADQGGATIMFAHWPKPLDDDFKQLYRLTAADEEFVRARQSVVFEGRKLRSECNIASNKRIRFVLSRAAGEPLDEHERKVIQQLLHAETLDVIPDHAAAQGTPSSITPLGVLYMPLEGLLDIAAEADRLDKEIAKVRAELETVGRKLSSEAFVKNAPPAVVEEHRQRRASFASRLAHLQRMRDAL